MYLNLLWNKINEFTWFQNGKISNKQSVPAATFTALNRSNEKALGKSKWNSPPPKLQSREVYAYMLSCRGPRRAERIMRRRRRVPSLTRCASGLFIRA